MSQAKSFADMTEDERVEWAKNHTWKPFKKIPENVVASTKRKNIRQDTLRNISRAKDYRDPVKRKATWGDDYNARNRYLYQHNETFRELKKYRVAMRDFQMRKYTYDAWTVKYYTQYKNKMGDNASTFRIEGTHNYLNGFTLKDLVKYSPVGAALLKSLIAQGIAPAPKYRGHKYVKDKWTTEIEEFYLVSEVEAYLNVFARYRKKFTLVKTDEQKAFLKKQFWTRMNTAREEFDND